MAQIFPRWTNKLPLIFVILVIGLLLAVVGFFWYYGSPKYTDMGYRPVQPVKYSHLLHAGDLGMDCRYCHFDIEYSPAANIPTTQVCMNCHSIVGIDNDLLQPVRDSWSNNVRIHWVRVHQLPDYVYFTHSAHLSAGVGCSSCHGDISAMEVVEQKKPLSMSWCLDCHRDPAMYLRPETEITNMTWQPPADQLQSAKEIMAAKRIAPPTDCSGCHR